MLSVGPFPLPAAMLAVSLAIAVIVSRRFGRRVRPGNGVPPDLPGSAAPPVTGGRKASSVIFDMFFIGVAVARLAFVLRWLPAYSAEPWAVLRIGDGGFVGWAGLLAALGWGAWKLHREPGLRRPLVAGGVAGLLTWGALLGAVWAMQHSVATLPATEMSTLDGERTSLVAMSGRPLVVNLWATWCPPCRREMPVLASGQRATPGIGFVFVNQGEGPDQIHDYLQAEGLTLDNVLLDPFSSLMHEVGARGLPTTLFFDADGRLVDFHMGELTHAGLASKLQTLDPSPRSLSTTPAEVP